MATSETEPVFTFFKEGLVSKCGLLKTSALAVVMLFTLAALAKDRNKMPGDTVVQTMQKTVSEMVVDSTVRVVAESVDSTIAVSKIWTVSQTTRLLDHSKSEDGPYWNLGYRAVQTSITQTTVSIYRFSKDFNGRITRSQYGPEICRRDTTTTPLK